MLLKSSRKKYERIYCTNLGCNNFRCSHCGKSLENGTYQFADYYINCRKFKEYQQEVLKNRQWDIDTIKYILDTYV